MVRKAALIATALVALPATAQTTNTQCRWIGSLWSCDSQSRPQTTAPADQSVILRSGAAMVPPYQASPKAEPETIPIPPPISVSGKYSLDAEREAFVKSLLEHCAAGTDIKGLPAERQQVTGVICYAYDQGRIAEILRK